MYSIYIRPDALSEIKRLPGHVRQRIKRVIDGFENNPRPSSSIELSNLSTPLPEVTLHRFKLEKWRIIYAIDEEAKIIDVLAIRQRPPYDYGDLSELLKAIF